MSSRSVTADGAPLDGVDAREPGVADALPMPTPRGRALRRGLLTFAVLVATTFIASRLASWDEVVAVLGSMSTGNVLLVGALTAANIATYWFVLTAAVPGLTMAEAASVQLPSTTLSNVAPGGGALGTAFTVMKLRSWGHSVSDVAAALLVNGVLGMVAKITAALGALLVLSPSAEAASAAPMIAGVGLVVLLAVVVRLLVSPAAARTLSTCAERLAGFGLRLVGRPVRIDIVSATMRVQRDVRSLVRRRWLLLVTATVTSHTALFLLFVACFRAVGVQPSEVSTSELLGSFGVARLAALIPLTPGGVGLIEISLGASLTATGGDPAVVVAGVALYRFSTYVVPTVLGAFGLAGWALANRSRRADAAVGLGDASVPLVVDLDGTLLPVTSRSIMLARLMWRCPTALPVYWRRRRADRLASKFFLLDVAGFDPAVVPVDRRLLLRLEVEHCAGRPLYLASGAPDAVVQQMVERSGVFVGGWGSTPDRQLVGHAKAALLCEWFGEQGFDYIGDAHEDIAVWERARVAVLFHPSRKLARAARQKVGSAVVLRRPSGKTFTLAARYLVAASAQRPARVGPRRPRVAAGG